MLNHSFETTAKRFKEIFLLRKWAESSAETPTLIAMKENELFWQRIRQSGGNSFCLFKQRNSVWEKLNYLHMWFIFNIENLNWRKTDWLSADFPFIISFLALRWSKINFEMFFSVRTNVREISHMCLVMATSENSVTRGYLADKFLFEKWEDKRFWGLSRKLNFQLSIHCYACQGS